MWYICSLYVNPQTLFLDITSHNKVILLDRHIEPVKQMWFSASCSSQKHTELQSAIAVYYIISYQQTTLFIQAQFGSN
jgi:general stress protein 26